jgi:hypothetical protein
MARTVERDDEVGEVSGDFGGIALDEEAAAEDGRADAARAQFAGLAEEVGVKQRLAAGEDDPFDAELFYVVKLAVEFGGADFLDRFALPDVAHRAPAVADAVRVEDERGRLKGGCAQAYPPHRHSIALLV